MTAPRFISDEERHAIEKEREILVGGQAGELSDEVSVHTLHLRVTMRKLVAAVRVNAQTLGWSYLAIEAWVSAYENYIEMLEGL